MRYCLYAVVLAVSLWAAEPPSATLQGKLVLQAGRSPAVAAAGGQMVRLEGDDSTLKVLADQRLNGYEVEAKGHYAAPGRFVIDPFHTHGLMARQDGKVKLITYFCDVCNVRANTPGPCACCQKETVLELRDPDQPEK